MAEPDRRRRDRRALRARLRRVGAHRRAASTRSSSCARREIVERHLPPGRLRVLDVGGGDRRARALARARPATRSSSSTRCRATSRRRDALAAEGLAVTRRARRRARARPHADDAFDVVLLLGPLYHLTERADRVPAWREALRVAKPGGLVIAAAITRFASLFDGLTCGVLRRPRRSARSSNATSRRPAPQSRPRRRSWFTTAYFHHPDELAAEAAEAGARGRRGRRRRRPRGAGCARSTTAGTIRVTRETILTSTRSIESEPTLLGAQRAPACAWRANPRVSENCGMTCLPIRSMVCITCSWPILYGFTRQSSRSTPAAS